jgi:hypothetical protein
MSWVASVPWRFVGWRSVFGLPFGKEKRGGEGPRGPTHAAVQCTRRKAPSPPCRNAAAGTGMPWAGVVVFLAPFVVNVLASVFD